MPVGGGMTMGIVSALGMLLLMGVIIALPFVTAEQDSTGEDDE